MGLRAEVAPSSSGRGGEGSARQEEGRQLRSDSGLDGLREIG